MHSKAKVYTRKGSPYYHAWFLIWDAKRQKWKPKTETTRCTDEAKALEIAKEYERLALACGPSGHTRVSREFVMSILNDIMRISGHRDVEDVKPWNTFSQAWLEGMKKRIRPKNADRSEGSLSLTTWQTYSGHVKSLTLWLGKEASIPLTAITGEMMQDWYRHRRQEGLAATTMNNTATTLGSIFERAKDQGFTTRNPVNLIDRDEHEGQEREPFTTADMDTILAYLSAKPNAQDFLTPEQKADWLTVTLLGLCTSQRLTDCANSLKTQIDQGKPWWTWSIRQGKTGTSLRIPIVEPLLTQIKKVMARKDDSLFLAPSLEGQPAGEWDGLSAQFAQILDACGVEGRKVKAKGKGRGFNSKTFHSTRHTCNSLLANAGVPPDIRQKITGHADEKTNLIYTHIEDTTKARALTRAFKKTTKKAAKKKATA